MRILVVTGAGISAESGLPTFREAGGYWRNLDPTKLATQSAFDSDPGIVWQWYRERREMIRRAQPNAAHARAARRAARHGRLIEINPDDQFLGGLGAEWIKEPAASALPRIVEELTARPIS